MMEDTDSCLFFPTQLFVMGEPDLAELRDVMAVDGHSRAISYCLF